MMSVGQIVTLKKDMSRRLKVLAISDYDIVTVLDLKDGEVREFDINALQSVWSRKEN